jgi:ABC-type sugar transport system substrate-binding protein
MSTSTVKWGARASGVLALGASLIALSACGSDDSSSTDSAGSGAATSTASAGSDDVAQAEASVTKYKADKDFVGPESSPPGVKGKSITVIACPLANEGCTKAAKAVKTAGGLLGWKVNIVDGQGSPQASTAAMKQAIAAKTEGIALVAIDKEMVSGALPAAQKAKIPVVSFADNNVPGDGPDNVFAVVNLDANVLGTMIADWVVADSNGKANVAMFNAPELSTIQQRYDASKKVFEACGDCDVSVTQNFQLATSATQLPLLTTNVLTKYPDVDYLWDPSGGLGSLQATAVDQSASKGKVKTVTFDCVSTNLKQIKSGSSSLVACAGTGEEQSGFAIVDQLNRAFAGEPPAASGDTIPFHLIDKTNAPEPDVGWPGDPGFEAGYKKLWGLS